MASADAGHAARQNLAAFLYELGKNVGALVVDQIHLFDTELTDFLFAEKLALAAARSAGTATRTTGSAFTARTAAGTTFATGTAVTAFVARPLMPLMSLMRSLRRRGRLRWSGLRC